MKLKLALFSSLVLLAHVANAQPGEGYTTGASGGIARDGFGGCVRTDSTGAAEYNQKLSERRAESVKAELVKNGIDPKVISTQGRGAREPLADNETREGRAKNRRVAVTVTGTQ